MGPLSSEEEASLRKLAAQYFQAVELPQLSIPASSILIKHAAQQWIYQNMFNEAILWPIPPLGYRSRLLKLLLAKIEESILDPEVDVRLSIPAFYPSPRGVIFAYSPIPFNYVS